jgi:ATP-dependent Lon protease
MLTGGFYAELEIAYDPTIAQEKNGRPFGIESLREIQLSKREVLPALYRGRESFAAEEWRDFLIRSVGLEPEKLTPRARDMVLLRMVPFVDKNLTAFWQHPIRFPLDHVQVATGVRKQAGSLPNISKM